jgi:hypothetical protein
MKTIIFLSSFVILSLGARSQTVGYDYDLVGNRIRRVLGVSSTNRVANNDSLPSYYEPTMKLAMEYGISVFPNPTSNNINIVTNKIPEGESATIFVYDNTGRTLKKIDHVRSQEEISFQEYKAGIYNVAIIISNNDKLYYKIIKQ